MTTMRIPGLIDAHVHMREPGGAYKETWTTGTAAALAGGFTTVLAMPNTTPALTDEDSFESAMRLAAAGARCDYGHFVGAGLDNVESVAKLADRSVGLKMYLGQTFGDLRLDDQAVWRAHLEAWPTDSVVAIHADGDALGAVIALAEEMDRSIHVCHVAGRDDITAIAQAKHRGVAITCEATPHHLFLDESTGLPAGRAEVRPRLGSPADRQALWDHLEVIDCFATDHAPHTVAEKDGLEPPPGFPGLETALPLLITAVHAGLLTMDDVIDRLHRRPVEIFRLSVDDTAEVVVDIDEEYEIAPAGHSRCGWTPFAGMPVRGKVTEVLIAGVTAYEQGTVFASAGTGRDIRRE